MKNVIGAVLALALVGCGTVTQKPLALRALRINAPTYTGPYLTIERTNVTDQCMVTWVLAAPTDSGGGSGTVGVTSYTGPAYILTAQNLTNGSGMFILSSTNLIDWAGYPSPGFQLTLVPTNNTSIVIEDGPTRFYWGTVGSPNF